MKFSTVFSVALLVGFASALPVNPRVSNLQRESLNHDGRSLDTPLIERAKVKTTPKTNSPSTTKKEDSSPTSASGASSTASACQKKRADTGRNNNNNCDDADTITLKTSDNKDVKFKLGSKVGAGSGGTVYDVNCGSDTTCKGLGSVVVKEYRSDADGIDTDRQALKKINELKASGKYNSKEYTVMVKQEGVVLQKTEAYKATKANTDERKEVVEDAIKLSTAEGTDYINKFGVRHMDNQWGNVLFKESGGKLTSAKLVDWEDFENVSGSKDAAIKTLGDEMKTAFDLFLED